MIERIRTRAVWLAVGLIFGGGAFAFAGATSVGAKNKPTKEPAVTSTEDADDAAEAEELKLEAEEEGDEQGSGERKQNHGFFVSKAAHCEDVEDTENELTFTAPEDCEDNGQAHGKYVSEVAKSEAGKKAKEAAPANEGGEEGS